MSRTLIEKIKESLISVLPITIVVLILSVTVAPMPIGTLMMFLAGAVLLIIGMGLFSLGAEISMTPMGENIGATLIKSKKVGLMAVLVFIMGVFITIAEPDLSVLAEQVTSIPNRMLILAVAVGVGIFFVVAVLRTLFKIELNHILLFLYVGVFILAYFAPDSFVPVSFDSGGVTTGPITVPFIMAMGVGMASVRGDKRAMDDSFGFVALCSIGPIIAVLLLGIFYSPDSAGYKEIVIPEVLTSRDIARLFAKEFPVYLKEVAVAVLPIMAFFLIFQLITKRFSKRDLIRISIGILYTFVGLVTFLTGVNVGFMPAGNYIGGSLAGNGYRWMLVPLGMLIGYFIVAAEPAVHVLNKQVEEITDGAISQKAMQRSLSIGVSLSVGLSMLRVLTGLNIFWILIPGYALALILTFFAPRIFTAIAFDSGGVASGPMTATFLLPFAMGACNAVGGNILTDAFGVVAMVAMTPLITIQILGVYYKYKTKATREVVVLPDEADELEFTDDGEELEYE